MDGARFRAARKERNVSQAAWAERLGVAATTVARWERGEQPIPKVVEALIIAESLTKFHERTNRDLKIENESLKRIAKLKPTRRVDDSVFKRLARKYHPDQNPEHAEIMTDLNELWQSLA
jgi:transcriptional regulator with XRE-family HTH domain